MTRSREIVATVLLASGILFTVGGAALLIAGQAVIGIVLIGFGLTDIALRFVLFRPGSRPVPPLEGGGGSAETMAPAEPPADPSQNPYAQED